MSRKDRIDLSGHHLKNAEDYLEGRPRSAADRNFFGWLFSHPENEEISIVGGTDTICRGRNEEERCWDYDSKTRECLKDRVLLRNSQWAEAQDAMIAEGFDLPVGSTPTIAELRSKLLRRG